MKLILKQDVRKLGAAGDLVEASDGYARNFLIPRGLAEEATPERMKEWQARGEARDRRENKKKAEAGELRKRLSGKAVRIKASTGEKGKLFGSVTAAAVAEGLASQHSASVDKRDVRLPDSVKQTGSYPFTVRLYPGIEAEMTLVVESE
jgi:large subunit ribosomal protein L9